jgi:4-hydroxy-tetrahydrodipicolinate synthase
MTRPQGLIVPVATPLQSDGSALDRPAMARLVAWLVNSGADALFVNGSFGGFAFHSPAKQVAIAETVCELAAGRLPVFAGVSDLGLDRVRALMHALAHLPIDAYVLLPPLYYVHSQADVERFCLLAADYSSKPIILYENPRLCANRILPPTIARLAQHPNIIGVKDSSPDESEWLALLDAGLPRDRFSLICGAENAMARALELGFDGITGGFHNLVPSWAAALMRAARALDFAQARAIQARINRAYRVFEVAGGWRGTAEILRWMGIADRIAPAPFDTPLSASEVDRIHEILEREGVERPDRSHLSWTPGQTC